MLGPHSIFDRFFVDLSSYLEPCDVLNLATCCRLTEKQCKVDVIWQGFARRLSIDYLTTFDELRDYYVSLRNEIKISFIPSDYVRFSSRLTIQTFEVMREHQWAMGICRIWGVLSRTIQVPMFPMKRVELYGGYAQWTSTFFGYWFFLNSQALRQIKELNLSRQSLETLPNQIYDMTWLKWLDLSHNKLRHLDAEICQLGELGVLSLRDNRLVTVPEEMELMHPTLWAFDLRGNPITTLPQYLEKKDHENRGGT